MAVEEGQAPPSVESAVSTEEVPVLAVRDTVIFPGALLPITIGRPSSIALVQSLGENRTLAVVAQLDPRIDTPGPEDMYQIGTICVMHKAIRVPKDNLLLFCEGIARIRTREYTADDPFLTDQSEAFVCEPDGVVICRDGVIQSVGPYAQLRSELPPGAALADHSGCLVAPGFVDTHVHYVQTGIIGAQGLQLLDWLTHYTFVAEQAFADEAVARDTARVFCDELLRQGTTTALVFCSVHAGSVDALFLEAEKRNLRLIAGKVLMDRNAPAALTDTARSGYEQSKALIAKWHGRGRCLYAITPRFAGSSTPEQLELAGTLWREHPGTFVQTHIAENRDEIAWVMKLYPQRHDYLDIYAHYGLIGARRRGLSWRT